MEDGVTDACAKHETEALRRLFNVLVKSNMWHYDGADANDLLRESKKLVLKFQNLVNEIPDPRMIDLNDPQPKPIKNLEDWATAFKNLSYLFKLTEIIRHPLKKHTDKSWWTWRNKEPHG